MTSSLKGARTGLAAVQWLFFMFTNTIVIPLTIGHAFQLPPEEIAFTMQRAFLLTGAACLLQGWLGHRLALMEGQAGLWWGVIISLCASAPSMGLSLPELGGSLAVGVMLSGAAVIVLGLLGFGSILQRWFNSFVMFVVLTLLGAQLVFIFAKGMLGLNDSGTIDPAVAGLSIAIVALTLWLNIRGRGFARNFSILIGIVVGWAAYVVLFPAAETVPAASGFAWRPFVWGEPDLHQLNAGIILMSFITGLLSLSNTVATLKAAEELYGRPTTVCQYKGSFTVTGFMYILSGIFSLVPFATYASSIGFLQSTRITERRPFMIGACAFALFGVFPPVAQWFASMPLTVGNAVLFVAYLSMFGSALRHLEGIRLSARTIYRVALPIFVGLAWMTIPNEAWVQIPALVRPLVSNGLLMGILLTLLLEWLVPWERLDV
ncbi:uracil/xanthine transporter [Paenibacillus profundus]|uniref:Uracil/xanthine transporter n=1 Tax=Paenibacillus profundus TaxID=1173085 RepID=A0ABS8YJ18_9BACL|nr:uracil/xanthine transporter [Paenibacillus profundus]MCE5170197.1 uracil/xanthine transporter [Paenibacillus profundus]